MVRSTWMLLAVVVCLTLSLAGVSLAAEPTAAGGFVVKLPPHPYAGALLADSPFGINTNLRPGAADMQQRLDGFQDAGIKWGRQGFSWRNIEQKPGQYTWEAYDKLVDDCLKSGLRIFGQFSSPPDWKKEEFKDYDPGTPAGVQKYAAFCAAATKRYAGKVDHWQIWNEPNGEYFYRYSADQYAALLSAAGKAIHQANPDAKVLALNMAFCDVVWADKVLSQTPYDAYDIVCFHPYRAMSAPDEKFDWWMKDQYVKSWHPELGEDFRMIRQDFPAQIEELATVMQKYGKLKPMWVTEICWNTNIHPYGTPEIRQADMIVRFYVLGIASQKVQKMFWWTFKDGGDMQYDMGNMVGLVRTNYEPKYSYYSFAFMTRMLEGKKWLGNFIRPDVYAITFQDPKTQEYTIVAWATKPYAYIKVSNTEKGLTMFDVFGTKRFVPFDKERTSNLTVPLGESPIYIVGPAGTRVQNRPAPGW